MKGGKAETLKKQRNAPAQVGNRDFQPFQEPQGSAGLSFALQTILRRCPMVYMGTAFETHL